MSNTDDREGMPEYINQPDDDNGIQSRGIGTAFGLWLLFTLFILYGSLIPFKLVDGVDSIVDNMENISFIPFMNPDGTRVSIPDSVQNILLFLPFGFLGFMTLKSRVISRIAVVTLLGFSFSVWVEIMQLLTVNRITSINDVLTNTAGSFLGATAAGCILFASMQLIHSSRFRIYAKSNQMYPALTGALLVLLGAFQPFDFTLDVGIVGSSIRGFIQDPFGFNPLLKDELVIGWRIALFSYATALFIKDAGHNRHLIKSFGIVVLLSAFGEACQFIIISRSPTLQDVIVITIGSACGTLLALNQSIISRLSDKLLLGLFLTVTIASAAVWLLHPFRPAATYRMINLFPFLPYYERTTFLALSNFIESAMTYFPTGFVLHFLLYGRRSARMTTLFIVLLISLPLELGQGWIIGRYPDVTDILGALLGAFAGSWCCLEGWRFFNRFIKKETGIRR